MCAFIFFLFFIYLISADPIPLTDGAPKEAQIAYNVTDSYQISFASGSRFDVTFSATPLQGDVLLFVSTTQPPVVSNPSTYQLSSGLHYEGKALVFRSTNPQWPSSGIFYVAVYGASTLDAKYRVVAASNSSNIILVDGIPIQGHCETTQSEYFMITVPDNMCNLTVTVTPLSGDPDIFVSMSDPHPSANATWSSASDSLTISPATSGPYYITIYANQNSTFSLVGEIDCQGDNGQPTYLIDGIPLQGVLAIGQEKLYTFHVQDDHADISISVSRRYGDPDIYVRNDGGRPSPQSYMWASTYSGEDLLTIYPNDPHWCTNCNYTIGVFASTDTSYSILAVTSTHILTLQEGVPVREDLLQASYEYFRFDVDSSSLELTISVTPLGNGDPDLYVSTMNPPNRTSYQWMAQSRYGDSVTITHTDPRACQFCTYWISVYAFSNTTFTIVATQTGTIRIQDGVPQSGFVDREAFTYYQFQIAGPSGLSMTCTTLNGSSSLYVTSGDIYPRTDYYQWFQPSFNQIKSLSLGCPNVTCNYWIGIYGNDASSFTLLTSSTGANGSTKVLVGGIPQRDTVPQGAWDYFSVKVEVANSDLSIIVTPITGDPDLYISMTNSRPNSTSYDRKATRAGSDSIDFTNATLGTYYIGVNAWTNSTFNILALITPIDENCTDTNPYCIVQLFDGQPQEGVVHQAYYDYYALDLSSAAASLSFTLTKEYGDPDLYITNDGSMPNISNHRWSSTSVQNDSVYIQNATAGRYLVAVYAYQTSGYTLTGWTTGANNIVTLQNGIPIRGQGNAHTYQYYMLPIDSTDRDFTVTVTPFSGDPDLYVSINVTHPNATSFTWAATAYQGDSITVPMTDPRFCNCPFYIAVYCYMASTYSLIGSYTDVLNLENGVPQSGAVALHAMKYYKLRVVETHQDITIALTPRDGNPDLYVSNGTEPTVGNATWKVVDQTFSTSMLVIRTSDPNFCSSNCTYYIGVYGSLASNFTIVATISSATTTLISGVPFRDWVDTGTYEYFAFDVPTAGSDVAIILTPLTGDPDLYVSSNTSRPNTTNYQYYSRAAGADAVAIESSNATTWYIAVYAFQNSTFTVTAYILCDDCPPVWLVNGMPQNSILNQNDYQYYRFSVPNNSSELTIAVTRTLGDPDIYVRNDGLLPNKTFYNWSASAFGQDLISISNPVAGIYDIAVFAYSTTQFTITASSGGVTLLADGVAVREDLAQGQYEYFQVHVDRTDMDLTVTVTSFNGDPDLYISTLGLPNSSFSQWAAQSPREDSITIPFSSLTLGTYWISVRAWTNCTFTIIASFNNEVSLQDGIPQAGSVAYEASVYYKFVVGEGHSDLTFTLTPYTGNAYLFISINSPPNQTNYLWASKDPTTGQAITIFPDDPNWCTANSTVSCVYYAMVYGHQASNYSIVAIANGTITLQEGIPQRAYVNTAEYEYFTFVLHSATALLQFTVTPLSGDPDLYVSTTNERPNISDYQWASLAYGADTISIDYTDPHYIQGTYYVAVYAYRNSSFTIGAIVIELNGSTACDDPNICPYNLIQNGVPQVGLLPNPGDKQYYEFHVGPERVNITFTVTPRYGDPDMYIRNDDQRPNSTFNQWSARSYGSDSVTIPASDGCTNCRYLIDVEAFSHTMFSLLASTDSGIILLENGVPFSTHNDEHTYKYFYVLVTDDSEPLTISATALSGDPDLYVSQNSSRPNQTNYQWASLSYGSDTFVLAKPTPGQYYVSTYAYHNTSYIILATNGPISLINCAPQNDELDKGQTRLYQIIVRDTNMSDILITLSVESGDPIMYMNNYQNRSYPNASNYQWTTAIASATTQRYLINVSSSSSGYCSNCTYFIQVAANTTLTKYSITASYGNNCSTSLSSGTPFPSSVVQGGYVYFRGIVDRADVDLTISVTTFTGDTDVYVSVTPNPNINDPNSYQWSSVHDPNARGDVISIPHTDPHFQTGMYYIAVYGWQTSQFTITMSTSAIVLSAGASQVGVLSSDLTAYFFFRVPSPTDVIFSLNPFNATSTPSLYTLYISTDGSVTQPDEQHHTFQFSVMEGQSVTIPSTDSHTCVTPCTGYYIGVTGATAGKKFTIVASTDDTIDALFSGVNFAASVSQSRIKNFLIYVPVANLFTVELQTCAGNADLYISQDSFNPGPGNYKWSSTSTDSVDIQTIRDANATNAANMYIGVEGKDAGINEYVLTAWTSALPAQPKISQPVIHSTVGSSTVILSFTAASSPDFPPSDLEYTVYWILDSQSQNFVMYSPCGLAKGKNFGLQTSPSFKSSANDTVFFTINGLDTETEYKITVVVTDPRGSTQFYDTIIEKTTAEGGGGISISLLLGIGLPVAALVLGFIFYLLIRNRKLTKELEIEMHDVPKATLRKAVAGPPSVREGQQQDKQKPYTRLLEEEDDENYAPPEPSDPSAGLSVN